MTQEWINPDEVFGDKPEVDITARELNFPEQENTNIQERPEAEPREEAPLKARRGYKVGEVDLDKYPTAEIPEPGIGRPLERGEMNTLDRAKNDEEIARLRKELLN